MNLGNREDDYSIQDPSMAYSVNRGAALSPYLNIDPSYLNQGGAEFVFPTDSKKKKLG